MSERVSIRQLWMVLAVLCWLEPAHALDPSRMLSQYVREHWGADSVHTGAPVHAVAQTADGYLWIGTDKGLVRFDGFSFRAMPFSPTDLYANTPVLGLMPDGRGDLWVRLQGVGVLRRRKGQFEGITSAYGPTASEVTAIWRESGGSMLAFDLARGILRFHQDRPETLASPDALPGSSPVITMAETSDGKIWMGTLGAGLFYLSQGHIAGVGVGPWDRKINCLLPVGNHELWVGTDTGLFHWNGTRLDRGGLPSSLDRLQVLTLLQDRDGNVWAGTATGLVRINAQGVAFSDEKDLRGNGGVNALFEDREGNLWVGGAQGVERIRDSAFITYSNSTGLPSVQNGPVYADSANRIWFAPQEGGLYFLRDGRARAVHAAGLDNDVVYSITGVRDDVWVGRRLGGLTHLHARGGTVRAETFTQAQGLAQNSVYVAYRSRDGAVWAGTLSGGISRFKDGHFITYSIANGLASNTISAILETRDGSMWFATAAGISVWADNRWKNYGSHDGLPPGEVNCLAEDSSGRLWVGTSVGLAFFSSGQFETTHETPDKLRGQVLGLAQDKAGWLWVATSDGIIRVQPDKLAAGDTRNLGVREYGLSDGLASIEGVKRANSLAADSLGRIWFSMGRGLSVVDPSHLPDHSAPALASVEAVVTDGKAISVDDAVRVPPGQKRITLRYTGLCLAVPERVRFRYMLEGFDRTWSEPVALRETVYTNLGPGSYRFHLMASNGEGSWNGPETVLSFRVDPVFWQTWWFRVLLVAGIGLGAWALYQLRLRQLTQQLHLRFEERLAERTRIAQELHDTLLQGFLSASMQLHVADEHLPAASPAKPMVTRVLGLMRRVIDESRNAVRGLRSESSGSQGLDQAFSHVPEEIGGEHNFDFKVIVEGQSRPLHPMIRDEVYRIGREALVNSCRHAQASNIEVELEFGAKQLRILVRDNGCGIDPQVLRSGREGHWGLTGMRERAERIGARLRVWSRPAGGTEVELSVPASLAFESKAVEGTSKWLGILRPRKPKAEHPDVSKRAG